MQTGTTLQALLLVSLLVSSVLSCARAPVSQIGVIEDEFKRNSLSLNGEWERLVGHGDQKVWRFEVGEWLDPWEPVAIPGALLPDIGRKEQEKIETGWVARAFEVDSERVGKNAVLRWNGIRFGAEAWINVEHVGQHTPIGPHTILLPKGILLEGENRITLKIPGWAGIPKSRSGYPLFPAGSGTTGWP